MIRLALLDDHPLLLSGLQALFASQGDIQVVHACTDGEALFAALERSPVDVLVLDLRLPGMNGLDVLRRLRRQPLPPKAVLLTAAFEEDEVVTAVEIGARGVVLKEAAPHTLVRAVRTIHGGGEWLADGLGARVRRRLDERSKDAPPAGSPRDSLTARERDVIRMLAQGQRTRDIAAIWGISEGTVKIHLHNIYTKLGVDGRVALILYARANGLDS